MRKRNYVGIKYLLPLGLIQCKNEDQANALSREYVEWIYHAIKRIEDKVERTEIGVIDIRKKITALEKRMEVLKNAKVQDDK